MEAKIPHEMVRKKRGGGNRAVIVRMPVLSRPFLINIAFALEFYSPSFSIRRFPAPETYCIHGKHSRKYGTLKNKNLSDTMATTPSDAIMFTNIVVKFGCLATNHKVINQL